MTRTNFLIAVGVILFALVVAAGIMTGATQSTDTPPSPRTTVTSTTKPHAAPMMTPDDPAASDLPG